MEPFDQVVLVARAVAVPTRLALLQVLGEQGCSLTTAAATVGVSPATAAHHLAVLASAGLVTKTVKGRKAIYRWSRSRWQLARMSPPAPTMSTEISSPCAAPTAGEVTAGSRPVPESSDFGPPDRSSGAP